jgi:hypothetical protein
MLCILRFIQYLLGTALIGGSIYSYVLTDKKEYAVPEAVSLIVLVVLFFFNLKLVKDAEVVAHRREFAKKAEIYSSLLSNDNSLETNTAIPARQKALQYSQDLIDDYKKVRNVSRNLYYFLQISTVILSGVTPILVLVDKLEAGQAWLKWLPVICPAVASIVASIVTSFPFQKNSLAANTAVELLEAEQEKFILGVTQAYRAYDATDPVQQQLKTNQAIEEFIVQVNNIHLNLVQQNTESSDKKDQKASVTSENPAPDSEKK